MRAPHLAVYHWNFMKINIVVGGRFNAPQMALALARQTDVKIYSSAPSKYWPGTEGCVKIIPHPSIVYAKLFRKMPGRKFKDTSALFFSKIAAKVMRKDADVIYAWATFGLEAMISGKSRGALSILDRACPHITYQEALLSEEADKLGVNFHKSARSIIGRCLEEYDVADLIVVPSLYTKRTFLECGIPENKIHIIGLGPNFQQRESYFPTLPSHQKKFTVGIIAGSILRKGIVY